MKVSGFTFIRNAIINDYPIVQAIQSVLPLCDEFVVAVGKSDDETLELIKNIPSDKIRIIETIWDENVKKGGRAFALETDKAYREIAQDTDWAFYIQGDECVHEKYHPLIRKEMERYANDDAVEGLLFKYLHFYGSYDYTAVSRRWYRYEIRLLKYDKGVHSYRDAQGFRRHGRKIRVKPIDAYIYHYGWVKPPKGLGNKVRNFNRFYQNEPWAKNEVPSDYEFDYGNAERLVKFTESHPKVMQERINTVNWKFSFDPVDLKRKMSLRRRILQKIEDLTGWRVGEYKNYERI